MWMDPFGSTGATMGVYHARVELDPGDLLCELVELLVYLEFQGEGHPVSLEVDGIRWDC